MPPAERPHDDGPEPLQPPQPQQDRTSKDWRVATAPPKGEPRDASRLAFSEIRAATRFKEWQRIARAADVLAAGARQRPRQWR